MSAAPLPKNESVRLQALSRYHILDSSPEPAFDDLARLASRICETPIALISFVDRDRVWLKSRLGWDILEAPRELAVCSHAIMEDRLLLIGDLSQDARFANHPFVTGPPHVRFSASMPLRTQDGMNLGTLCVMHHQPHSLDARQCEALEILARQVMTQLELRRGLSELAQTVQQHQETERRLMDSESFYQTLVESLPQNIIRKDLQGRFTFANNKFCQSIGRAGETLIGKTDFDLFPNELASKYHRDDLRVMATKESLDTVEAHQTPDGEKSFVHVIKTPLYDAEGRVVGIQGIFWDVTHRKRIEEALAYERDLLRALLDHIPDRIYFKDVQSRFLRCSASMIRRLGLSDPKEVVGKTDFDFRPQQKAEEFYNDEQRIILTGQPLINKLEHQLDIHGQEAWASVTKVPIYNQSGSITGIIGITRDITQLKMAEKELEMARDAALESARVKSQFLANMSHEIRTPMNAITGMTTLLKDTPLNAEQREFADTISHSTSTLLAIINEILDYSKVEAGKLALETIDFSARDNVESTVQMLADSAQSKGLELACWLDPALPSHLRGDPSRFRQVLVNLLSNAVKFTEKGHVIVRVARGEETVQHLTLVVAVTDTGIGIAENALTRIFEAFTQADGSTTRKYGGTGLGLTISRQLVQLMGGELTVESQLNQGTTFHCTIPTEKSEGSPLPLWMQQPEALAGKRVLVLDDSEACRQILLEQLRFWQVEASEARTHRQALRLLAEAAAANQPLDLLLMDLEMPEGDGLNLALQIHADASIASTKLVALTTYRSRVGLEEMQAAGMAGRLMKPVRQGDLWNCLVQAFLHGAQPMAAKKQKATVPSPAAITVRILLAEDNLVNQRVALSQLKKLGYSADAVTNGTKVLEAMMQNQYDIILMDCQMPEMDGYEVTRRLRAWELQPENRRRGRSPYIIALTANTLQGDRERCIEAGMNDYLSKPIDLTQLHQQLQRAVSRLASSLLPSASEPTATSTALAPAEAGPHPTLDPSVLQALRQLQGEQEEDLLSGLIELYLTDAKSRFEAIDTALDSKDAARLANSIHSLKGSSNNLGARRLGELCNQVEKLAKAGDVESSRQLLTAVRLEFELVREALRGEMR